jgi:hypothetical protein
MDEITLRSVNWQHGMLLSPQHFIRQEQYIDALVLWMLRYTGSAHGLVGGGPRLVESERGAVRHDPIVIVEEDEATIGISITQARGITPCGRIIEIQPDHPVSQRFPKAGLAGVSESNVYIVCDAAEKEVVDGKEDEFNPQMKTERQPAYRISLQLQPREAPESIAVAHIQRPQYGSGYEKDSAYIPPCVSLVSYSELTAAWRKIVEGVTMLADRYADLYRAMREFMVLFEERGIETQVDADAVAFVERMVVALQTTVYEILDPVQPPARFFGYLRRLFHSAALYMDLNPGVQQYYDTLKETGETEFIAPMEQQKRFLQMSRTWQVNENLAVEVRSALSSLQSLAQLERALEGKYIDFRVSTVLEGMNFIFDRGGKVLYKLAAKPARVQGSGEDLSIHFSNLRLEGRDKYRLILVGEQNATFERGARINVELRLNEGSGFRRVPLNLVSECRLNDQRNFEYDFEAPDVATINDARVTFQAHHPIRTALLYARHRFFGQRVQDSAAARPLQPPQRAGGAEAFPPQADQEKIYGADWPPQPASERDRRRNAQEEPEVEQRRGGRVSPASDPQYPPRPNAPPEERPAPWELPRRGERPRETGPAETPPPPRRRRLE